MRFRLVMIVAAVALACLASPAFAQQQPGGKGRGGPPGGFGGGGGFGISRLFLLRVPEVQKELELVDEQVTAIQKVQEELGFGGRGRGGPGGGDGKGGRGNRGKGGNDNGNKGGNEAASQRNVPADWFFVQAQDQNQKGRGRGGQPPTEEEIAQRLERARQEKAKLAEILLPHQMKRLNEIYIQQLGAAAFDDEDVAKELSITAAQKDQIAKIREDARAQRRELFQPGGGGDPQAAFAKMAELRKAEEAKAVAVLTAAQKTKFEELKGKPFDMPEGGLFGRGGPGGPGGRGKGKGGNNNN